jgi:GUN4-like
VILKPCLWNLPKIPFSKLNVLPNDALPVTQWNDPETAFTVVVENIARVVERLGKDRQQLNLKSSLLVKQPLVQPVSMLIPDSIQGIDAVSLESDNGEDYRQLQNLLKAGQWLEADRETLTVMLRVVHHERNGLDADSLKNFPCKDLKTIDLLWVRNEDLIKAINYL